MNTLKFSYALPSIVLGATLGAAAATPAAAAEDATPATGTTGLRAGQGYRGAGLRNLLGQLDLTAGQKSQIKAILVQARPQIQSLRAAGRSNFESLATTPPSDRNYAALVAAAQENAAARVQLRGSLWSRIYAVLTPEQQAKIPAIIAAQASAWAARKAAWQARHSTSE